MESVRDAYFDELSAVKAFLKLENGAHNHDATHLDSISFPPTRKSTIYERSDKSLPNEQIQESFSSRSAEKLQNLLQIPT